MKRNPMSKEIVVFAVALAVSMILMSHSVLYAHGILSKESAPGKIAFTYDNGSPLTEGFVTVYDKEGKEITSAKTDSQGVFDYSKYENVAKISAADLHGHHQTHVIEGEDHLADHHEHDHHHPGENTSLSLSLSLMIVVTVIMLAIAAMFYLRNKKTIKTPSE